MSFFFPAARLSDLLRRSYLPLGSNLRHHRIACLRTGILRPLERFYRISFQRGKVKHFFQKIKINCENQRNIPLLFTCPEILLCGVRTPPLFYSLLYNSTVLRRFPAITLPLRARKGRCALENSIFPCFSPNRCLLFPKKCGRISNNRTHMRLAPFYTPRSAACGSALVRLGKERMA